MPKELETSPKETLSCHRRFNEEDLKKSYMENVRNLEVYGEYNADLEKRFDSKLKEKDKRISTMQQEIHNLRNEIVGFQKIGPEFRIEITNMMAKEWEKLQQEKKKE